MGAMTISREVISQLRSIGLFRVLAEYDEECRYFVATCLETGSVATADSPELLKEAILDLLDEEIIHAAIHGDIAGLFSHKAPKDVWSRWIRAVGETTPETLSLRLRLQALFVQEKLAENPLDQTPEVAFALAKAA